MSEQITWTHVDKLVRKMHDEEGMLPVGLTDAEVAYSFLKWLDRTSKDIQKDAQLLLAHCEKLEVEVHKLRNAPKSKTKERLGKLEKEVERLGATLNSCPKINLPFTIGRCAKDGCLSDRGRTHYCDKCERDL